MKKEIEKLKHQMIHFKTRYIDSQKSFLVILGKMKNQILWSSILKQIEMYMVSITKTHGLLIMIGQKILMLCELLENEKYLILKHE
jgi:hypothetical protein